VSEPSQMASAEKLRVIQEHEQFRLSGCLNEISRGRLSGRLHFDVSFHYRVLAMCKILLEADPRAFSILLAKSGQARISYLERRTGDREPDDLFLCVSEDLAFENCLAGGELRGARTIARLSPDRRYPDVEYEDDFLYYYFLRMFFLHSQGEARELPADVLDRLERVLDGEKTDRVRIGRALCEADPGAFSAALEKLAAERALKIGKLRKTFGASKELLATDGAIFIEGLALLRLAETAGMRIEGEFRYMPALARVPPMEKDLAAGSWMSPGDDG